MSGARSRTVPFELMKAVRVAPCRITDLEAIVGLEREAINAWLREAMAYGVVERVKGGGRGGVWLYRLSPAWRGEPS